jgi:hypothetical protein
MRITLEPTWMFVRTTCCICHACFKPGDVHAFIDGDTTADVCDECVKAGADGMKRRALELAAEKEAKAAEYRKWAEEFQGETIIVPSDADISDVREMGFVERFGVHSWDAQAEPEGCPF